MPSITPQSRPQVTAQTSEGWIAPRKTVTQSTGMNIEKEEITTPEQKNGQPDKVVETDPEKAVTLSPQLTALARKEQKLRQQEQAIKADREKFESEKSDHISKASIKERIAAKDYSAFEELGLTYEEYTAYKLNGPEVPSEESKELKAIREEINGIKTSQEENIIKQRDATVAEYKKEISKLIASDERFSSIKEMNSEEYVLQHILDTFEEDGELLTVEEASKEIEDQIVAEGLKLANLKRVQEQITPQKKTLPPPKPGLKTLTNQVAATGPQKTFQQFQHLSPKERLAQAIAKASQVK